MKKKFKGYSMCGIFGYLGKNNAPKTCIKGLKRLEYRGYDSAGIATIQNNNILHFKTCGKISSLEKKINIDKTAHLCIGHTRWATHGPSTEKNAHPHFDDKQHLALVHNGIIENHLKLRQLLKSKGIKFRSQTDSEVIVQMIAHHYKKDLLKATIRALKILKGSLAIVLIHKDHPNEIIAAARESPLAIGFDNKKNEFIISSDPNAFSGKILNVLFLKNDEIAHINNNQIKIVNLNGKTVVKKIEKINNKSLNISKKGFEHFMLKEIFDQASTIQKTYLGRIFIETGDIEFENFNFSDQFLSRINNIILCGCGTSYHAGLIGASFFQEKTKIFTSCEISSEINFKNFIVNKNTLFIVISQSGETADTITSIKAAKAKGAKVLAIVNVNNSTIARMTDAVIFLKAGPEISVCSTKAFTSQVSILYMLAIYLAKLKSMKTTEAILLLKQLKQLPLKIKKTLNIAKVIQQKAIKYAKYNNFFFIGRNLMYAAAKEAALKLKEITYLNASAYPSGEIKHGPLALINSNLPVIAFCSNKKTYDKLLSNLMEIKARKAPILAFATKKSYGIEDIVDDVIWLENTTDELCVFLSSIAGQLFAYYLAKEKNTDIDQPRNLAKSVTVE